MLPSVVRIGRIISDPSTVYLKNISTARLGILNHVTHRYPTYSSYRSFWNTLIRRKEAATAAEEVKPTAESEKPVDLAHEELLKSIEEFKQESDELKVADVLGKATECVPKEEVTDSNPHLKNLYEGLTMTESVLKSVSMNEILK
ncbi:hypothetical protein V9T40_008847 [Parthenolecanium corni]|uniref:Uncharacterized protein n=1 Tax=Parthenolecanium corni TaxID=536013 RepID=A0AAN9TNV0_9HEMI